MFSLNAESAVLQVTLAAALGLGGLAIVSSSAKGPLAAAPLRQKQKTSSLPAKTEATPLLDAYGDPLPPSAFLRLGTIRFRPDAQVVAMAWSSDGKSLATGSQVPAIGVKGQIWDAATGRETLAFDNPVGNLGGMALSPDNKLVAFGDAGGALTLFELATGRQVSVGPKLKAKGAKGGGIVGPLHFGPDGNNLYSIDRGNQIVVLDTQTFQVRRTIATGNVTMKAKMKLAFNRDMVWAWPHNTDRIVALVDSGTAIRLIDVLEGKQLHALAHGSQVKALCLSPDGDMLATGGLEDAIHVWEVATGKRVRDLQGHGGGINALSWSPDGKYLASAGADKTMRLWEVGTAAAKKMGSGTVVRSTLRAVPATVPDPIFLAAEVLKIDHPRTIHFLEFSPDSKKLAYCDFASLRICDVATGKDVANYDEHVGAVEYMAALDNGTFLTSAADSVRIWDLKTGKMLNQVLSGHSPLEAAAVSPDGKWLATQGKERMIRLLELPSGKLVNEIEWPKGSVNPAFAFSPDGKRLAGVGSGRTWIFEIPGGEQFYEFKNPKGPMRALAMSPDGKICCTSAASGGVVYVWDVATGKQMGRLTTPPLQKVLPKGLPDSLPKLVFCPDGKLVAAACDDGTGTVCLWDISKGSLVRRMQEQQDGMMVRFRVNDVAVLAFSYDGRTMATAGGAMANPGGFVVNPGADRDVLLWEVATGMKRAVLQGHQSKVTALAFLPDSMTVIAGAADGTALCWDVGGRAAKQELPPALTEAEIETQWKLLHGPDGPQAYSALLALAKSPKEALGKLQKELSPAPVIDPKSIAQWIADLDSPKFAVRENATKELKKASDQAWPALQQVLTKQPTLELRNRALLLLGKQSDLVPVPERLHAIRSLELLERLQSPEARRLLETLAEGAPRAWLTEEVKAILGRTRRG